MVAHGDVLLGQVVDGYRLTGVLGTGGMSIVFRGQRSDDPGRHVAVKVLQPPTGASPASRATFAARFAREAQTTSRLRHEHIVPVLSYGEVEGRLYLVMPLIAGGTLASRLASAQESLPLEEIARYARQLASALDYAHEQGVVHRDVKPQNVLLDPRGDAYLTDFGIARLFAWNADASGQLDGDDNPTLTTVGALVGTPRYMAPEQIQGQRVGPAADIYGLGIVLYQLVTRRVPFSADAPLAVAFQQVHDAPIAPHRLRAALPLPASAAVLRALAKRPEDRFNSAGALGRAFAAGLEGRWTEGLSPQEMWLEQDTTFVDPHAVTLLDFSPVATVPTSGTAARPPLWPGTAPERSVRRRGTLIRGCVLAALGCLIVLGLAWGGSALVAGLTASSHTTVPPAGTATGTPAAPAISIGVQDHSVYATRAGDTTVLWSYSTSGNVLASPAVVNDVVYAATDDGHLYALQATDGTLIWSKQVDGGPVTSSPVVSNGVVYVATEDGHVYALQASDGTLSWQRHVHVNGNVTGPPTVADGTISIQTDQGTVYTLHASDGTLITPTQGGGDNG
jgi:eukaryotic-like serine/threonine-protein kinase